MVVQPGLCRKHQLQIFSFVIEQPDATSLEEVTGQSSNQVILEQPSQERPTQTSVEQPPFEETLAQPTNEELTQPHRAEPVSSGYVVTDLRKHKATGGKTLFSRAS